MLHIINDITVKLGNNDQLKRLRTEILSKSFDFSEVYSVAHLVAIGGTSTKNIPLLHSK